MIEELRKSFEERKFNLVQLLNRGELDVNKQHQVYGAVKELQNILKTIDDLEKSKIEERISDQGSNRYFQRLN